MWQKAPCRPLQVKYVFADKTGTLTENKMIFRQCSIAGIAYGQPNSTSEEFVDTNLMYNLRSNHASAKIIHEFLLTLAVCHTVVTEADPDEANKPHYLAASPDEAALVKAAASLEYSFIHRDHNRITVRLRTKGDSKSGNSDARWVRFRDFIF